MTDETCQAAWGGCSCRDCRSARRREDSSSGPTQLSFEQVREIIRRAREERRRRR